MSSSSNEFTDPAGPDSALDSGSTQTVEAIDPGAQVRPQPAFYRININNVSFRELWWGTPNPLVIIPWLVLKVFRARVPCSADDPAVEHLGDFEVPADTLPEAHRKRFVPFITELEALGFNSPIVHNVDDYLHNTETVLFSFAHPSLPVVARIHSRIWAAMTPAKLKIFIEFITPYSDGSFLWTLSGKPDFEAPPVCHVLRREKATISELWEAHQQERAKDSAFKKALPTATPSQVAVICEHLHDVVREFHVKRKVFVPLTADDQKSSAAAKATFSRTAGATQNPAVLAAIDKLLTPRTGWRTPIVLLVLSIIAFLIVGIPGQRSFLSLLALVPVLLFHEAGHYVAMKLCGYKNLRMFFIPGFGAAVTGRSFNVPGWKKVFVSLMGPVPGIFLGIVVGLCGVAFHKEMALSAGLLLVLLNGFNLVPMLPFDGGHVVHTILFSRHYILDILFRCAAAAGLIALSIFGKTQVLMYVAIPMLISLPYVIRVAKVTKKLRDAGFAPSSPDNQSIPPEDAEKIIAELKASTTRPQANNVLAQQTLSVFESLNTRPPGWLASTGLLLVYTISLALSIVFGAVFVVARQGSLPSFARAAAQRPQHTLSAADIRTSPARPGPDAASDGAPHITVVGTYAKHAQAEAAYNQSLATVQPGESVSLVGDTLLVRVAASDDAARKRWMDTFQAGAKDVFVHGGTMHATFRLQGIALNEAGAKSVEDKLKQYFELPLDNHTFIPPWAACTLSPQQLLARETFARLRRVNTYSDPAAEDLRKKITAARRAGDNALVKSLSAQEEQLYKDLERKGIQAVVDDSSGLVDNSLARRYLELYVTSKPQDFYKATTEEFTPQMGEAGLTGTDRHCALVSAHSGYDSRIGLVVQISYVSFEDPAAGAGAMIAWLDSQQVSHLHYDVVGSPVGEDDEGD